MKKEHLTLALAAVSMALHSHAAVGLQDFYAADTAGGAPTDLGGGVFGYEINLSAADFSAAGHDKLVLVYSGHDGNQPGTSTVTSVTYDEVPMNEAIYDIDNLQLLTTGIYYLDNVSSDGTLRIELAESNQVRFGFGLYALDGTKEGVQDTGTARVTPSEATVTMTTDTGFFVQEASRNNQSLSPEEADDYVTLYNYNIDSYRGLSQYLLTTEPGDYLAPIGNEGVNFRRIVTAAFEEDPNASDGPEIISITPLDSNLFELVLAGTAESDYQFFSSTTLDFEAGILLENLTQGDDGDPGTIGGEDLEVVTTDASGAATVRLTLLGDPADFVRAQAAPTDP